MGHSPPLLTELPYPADSADLFEAVVDAPWAMFLDSAAQGSFGRYDIIVADPTLSLVTTGGDTKVIHRDGRTERVDSDPFAAVRRYLGAQAEETGLPFSGGALGYFAYDLAWWTDDWPRRPRAPGAAPEMAVGIYDWAVIVDHQRRRAWLAGSGRDPETARRWDRLLERFRTLPTPSRAEFMASGELVSNLSRAAYLEAVIRIRAYLAAGDCYQVNLAQTFSLPVFGDPWSGYRTLRRINPAPFAAYLNTPELCVMSASPERFLRVAGGHVQTRPIKGTRARSHDPEQDARLAEALCASPKDRAENLMIVDLLRNDLAKSCRLGSIRVPELFTLESFASVHHLVSMVTGELSADRDPLHLLADSFPGGSITGAPKRRAMEIIDELEPGARGLYCGSIGYIGFDRRMDSNIAIRTLTVGQGIAHFAAGGGVVYDSDPEEEYAESLAKAGRLMALFGLSAP